MNHTGQIAKDISYVLKHLASGMFWRAEIGGNERLIYLHELVNRPRFNLCLQIQDGAIWMEGTPRTLLDAVYMFLFWTTYGQNN